MRIWKYELRCQLCVRFGWWQHMCVLCIQSTPCSERIASNIYIVKCRAENSKGIVSVKWYHCHLTQSAELAHRCWYVQRYIKNYHISASRDVFIWKYKQWHSFEGSENAVIITAQRKMSELQSKIHSVALKSSKLISCLSCKMHTRWPDACIFTCVALDMTLCAVEVHIQIIRNWWGFTFTSQHVAGDKQLCSRNVVIKYICAQRGRYERSYVNFQLRSQCVVKW